MRKMGLWMMLLAMTSCSDRRASLPVGDWSAPNGDSRGTYIVFNEDHTFVAGDIRDQKRHHGLTGRWQVKGELLTLKIKKSRCCKIPERHEWKWRYRLVGDDRLVLALPEGDETAETMTFERTGEP